MPQKDLDIAKRRKAAVSKGMNKHIGSGFDTFLEEEGLRAEVEAVAVKRVIAYQLLDHERTEPHHR